MKRLSCACYLVFPLGLLVHSAYADDKAANTDQLIAQADRPMYSQPESLADPVAVTPQSTTAEHHVLPIWGDAARAKGYDLPLPFGVGMSYMNMRQNIDVDSISFSGLSLPLPSGGAHAIPGDMFNIAVGNTREKSETETLRLDTWLFPFLNVYVVVGYTDGSSVSQVSVDADPAKYTCPRKGKKAGCHLDTAIASAVHAMNQSGKLQNIDFQLDFKGMTYGAGFTLAGGYKNWFTAVDTNYTRTNFDILDGKISALTVTPRVGYRFDTPGNETLHLAPGHLSLWVGTMYQDVQQEFRGNLSDLQMPTELVNLINLVNQDDQGKFDVKQHLKSPWNVLIGTQYEVSKNFNILAEVGFSERNSFFISGEYRF
ncbi:hypothetical protein [Edaphovirga cremea]|uniref:hypothetical protein n=1 Tax=Edaphovirga cremea TaxID=2267246 RepID=UPI0039897DBB